MTPVSVTRFDAGDGRFVVRVRGEMDLSTVEEFGRRLRASCGTTAAVILDLEELAYVDSAGLRLIDQLRTELGDQARPLTLVAGPGAACRAALVIGGFERLGILVPAVPSGRA